MPSDTSSILLLQGVTASPESYELLRSLLRFAHAVHGGPLATSRAGWQAPVVSAAAAAAADPQLHRWKPPSHCTAMTPVLLAAQWPMLPGCWPLHLQPVPGWTVGRSCLDKSISTLSATLIVDINMPQRLRDGAAQVHRQPGRQRGGVAHPGAAVGAARRLAGPGRSTGALVSVLDCSIALSTCCQE
jgi:hypothetical protein